MNKKIPFPVFYSKQEQRYAAAAGIQNASFTKGGDATYSFLFSFQIILKIESRKFNRR